VPGDVRCKTFRGRVFHEPVTIGSHDFVFRQPAKPMTVARPRLPASIASMLRQREPKDMHEVSLITLTENIEIWVISLPLFFKLYVRTLHDELLNKCELETADVTSDESFAVRFAGVSVTEGTLIGTR
jgi:hypothetical protein